MTLPHLHLLLNHVPTVGTGIAIALLILTLVRKHDALRRVSLELFCVIALLTLPAYLSGVGTALRIAELPDVSQVLMDRHHDAAVQSSILMLLTGAFAWLGLWQFRRVAHQSRFNVAAVLVLSVLTLALMAKTATMGGEIRHPEILVEGAAAPDAAETGQGWLTAASIASLVNERVWLWPAMETVHFIGLWLLFGVVLFVHLRMLGVMRGASFAALHRLLPWGMLGLSMNIVTGMMFVIANPGQYASPAFYWKMGLLVLAGGNLLYFTIFDGPWGVGAGDRAPARVQAMAVSAIALWLGVMYFGRMLPFLGDAF